MRQVIEDNVGAAFEILIEEATKAISSENGCGAEALRRGDYQEAGDRMRRSLQLDGLVKEIGKIQARWSREAIPSTVEATVGDRPLSEADEGARMSMTYNGARAKALYLGGPVVLLDGSTVRRSVLGSLAEGLRELRAKHEVDGTLSATEQSDVLRLTRRIRFSSPSAAAQFVAGCSVSGNRDWQVDGRGCSLGAFLRNGLRTDLAISSVGQPTCLN